MTRLFQLFASFIMFYVYVALFMGAFVLGTYLFICFVGLTWFSFDPVLARVLIACSVLFTVALFAMMPREARNIFED